MPASALPLVWLFDIDGTLLLTQGAGRDALSLALRDQFGVNDDLKSVAFRGRTDVVILQDICERHGLSFRDGELARFWDRVAFHMRLLMDPPRGNLLPGVAALLDTLSAEPGWVRALLTGNTSEMARIKLSSFGVYERFAWGAFGEEAPDRDALAKLAVRRAAERHGVPPERCIVVGDTEHDIACARAAGAHVVAVATGGQTRDELLVHAPDLVLEDLTDAQPLWDWAGRALDSTRES
jgi:phosphoglycolate phosphatase-like HAD superfamily hydrolase